jgi:hypothetical protein
MPSLPGDSQTVTVGATVTLDGSASAAHTYVWGLVDMPAGCRCTLLGERTATPSFVATEVGFYVLTLGTDDGGMNSVGIEVVPA